MATRTGIGTSEENDSRAAGTQAAKQAVEKLGGARADLVCIFQTAHHNPAEFHAGVRSVIGPDVRLVGGYAAGVIANGKLGYEGTQTAVLAFAFDHNFTSCEIFMEEGLKERGEVAVGEALAKRINAHNYTGERGMLYMYDSVKSHSKDGFEMNIGTHFIEGMSRHMNPWPAAGGFGMLGSINFSPTRQTFHDKIVDQAAIAMVFHGAGFRMDTTTFHGTQPASDYHTITKADKNVVLEIDGVPALEKISQMLGPGADTSWEKYPLLITLGVNRGSKWADFNEENYASRLCLSIDPARKGLVMFEPDLVEGTEIQLMKRHIDRNQMAERAQAMLDNLGSRKPFLAFYIDCVGRAARFCGYDEEEASVIQSILEPRVPMLGLYTGVEIGKVGSQAQQPLDWTGVLCILSEE